MSGGWPSREAMEKDSSNGSRNPGAIGNMSEDGERDGGTSVDQLTSSNQEEEDDGGSGYGSEEFDDVSKAGGSESEVGTRDECERCILVHVARMIYPGFLGGPTLQPKHAVQTHYMYKLACAVAFFLSLLPQALSCV